MSKYSKGLRFTAAVAPAATVLVSRVAFASVPTSLSGGAAAAEPSGASSDLPSIFQTITNTLLYIVGAVSVIMLIVGGLQYVLSSGDSKRVESAKNTILFAIVGIVVAIVAYAIVQFVFTKLS